MVLYSIGARILSCNHRLQRKVLQGQKAIHMSHIHLPTMAIAFSVIYQCCKCSHACIAKLMVFWKSVFLSYMWHDLDMTQALFHHWEQLFTLRKPILVRQFKVMFVGLYYSHSRRLNPSDSIICNIDPSLFHDGSRGSKKTCSVGCNCICLEAQWLHSERITRLWDGQLLTDYSKVLQVLNWLPASTQKIKDIDRAIW